MIYVLTALTYGLPAALALLAVVIALRMAARRAGRVSRDLRPIFEKTLEQIRSLPETPSVKTR